MDVVTDTYIVVYVLAFSLLQPLTNTSLFPFDSFDAHVVENVVLQRDIGLRVCPSRVRLKITKYNGETGVQNLRLLFPNG